VRIRTSSRRRRAGLALIAAGSLVAALAACTSVTNGEANCAFVVDIDSGKTERVILPGVSEDYNSSEQSVRYVPCNPRTFIVNDGTVKNRNGEQVGDRFNPSLAYTRTGTPVLVWSSSYWTLNQTPHILKNQFGPLCFKFTCHSTEATGGDANFSTKGWNGMLGEHHGSSVDTVAVEHVASFDDALWRPGSPDMAKNQKALGDLMSNSFAAAMATTTGSDTQLFCGSGNSGWKDPGKPGEGTFTCSNVRIKIDKVVPVDKKLLDSVTALANNAARLNAAKEVYGDAASFWLGLQDTIEKCAPPKTCVFNIGGAGVPAVNVPQPK
jgi:hypothetical protein